MKKITFFLMALLVSLASFAQATVPTNEELWEAFKPYYNEFYGLERADQPIENVASFAPNYMQDIMTNEASKFKWLGDYILEVAAAQEFVTDSEGKWRWHVDSFFNKRVRTAWPGSADFTEAGKPENWGPAYLAAQGGTTPEPEPEPEPTTETVYFVNAANWTKVNAYAWTTDPNDSWPGVAATKEAEQIAGFDVYSYTAAPSTYANVIFNNGSGQQTADLVWTAGKYYVKDGWYTKEEAEAKLAAPVEYESVYFVDNQGWGKANIYTWTPEVATWPGVAMTKEADKLAGYDVYSYTVEKGTSFGGMLFNNANGVQTGDLKWTAGKYYVKDAWYTKEEAEAKLAGPVTPPVITYVLMGVKGDWTTGIAMTQNPDNANEYVLLQQEILEGDAVKVVTLTDGTATAWCGNVDEYSVAHTADDMGNIVLAPGKYDFYYKVAEDLIYIGGEAYPEEPEQPELEKPEPTYTDNNLNPYAFGLESVLSEDKATLTVTYRLNNTKATDVDVVIYNGEEVVKVVAGTKEMGKNTVEIPTADLPGGVQLTWAVAVNGTSVEVPTQETKMYNLYCPHGLAIDTDPESENFGRILVAEGMQAVPTSGYMTSGKGAGLYVFNPSFTTDSVVYKGENDFTRVWASNGYQPWRVKISEDGRIFVSSLDLNGVVVWEVSKDLQTWTPVIAGTQGENGNILDAEGNFVAGMNVSMDVVGSGENLKLLLYSCTTSASAFSQSAFRLDEYALGTATTWTGTPKNILTGGKYAVVHTNAEWIYDGEGGYWFGASRGGNAGQANLAHINAEGVEDYRDESGSLYGGDGVLVHNGMLFKGKARTSGTVGNFGVWTIGKDADGKVTLTEKWSVVADGIGRNLNEFAVDYAENLYIVGNSNEKIIAYALPYSGEVETPAAAKYAFQLEGEAVEYTKIEMSNLVVTPYGEYDLLEASDAMTGIAVMLGVDADGKLVEGSEVTWNGTSMTILSSGVFTKAYNDELATDVYNGKLVIEFYGEEMGLDLYMYGTGAASSVDVVITDANITVDEWGSYLVSAPWEDGILTIEVSDTEYEGFMMLEYTITEDDWYIWMAYTATVTTVDNVMTIEGEFTDNYTGTTYNVTISGNLPNGTGTGLEDATVTIKAVKKIQNGQLIIEKDGVQYNVNGAIVK